MSNLDEEFDNYVKEINEGKNNFSTDEQDIINSWLEKLSEPQEEEEIKAIRNKYALTLAKYISNNKLLPPFTNPPPDVLTALPNNGPKNLNFKINVPGCRIKNSQGTRSTPKTKKNLSVPAPFVTNDFEDPEEMAKAIARSKGQSLAEFIVSISRHTSDFGQGLRKAMKIETSSFREYVDHILTQRIKDLTEVLNEEQSRELQKIKEDTDKWRLELHHVKRRIEEMIPEFDLDEYKRDKNYLKKMFTIKPDLSDNDSLKKWIEESSHRLKWICDKTCRVMRFNEQTMQELSNIECETTKLESTIAANEKSYQNEIDWEVSEYKSLQLERDQLLKENSSLLSQLKEMRN